MERTLVVRIPGSVWYDALDPAATDAQADHGLEEPRTVTRGKGWQAVYDDVPVEAALELAEYLSSRASMLLSQGYLEKYEADTHRAAIKAAERIRKEAGER